MALISARCLISALLLTVGSLLSASPGRAADELYLMTRMWSGSLEIDAFLFRGDRVARGPAGDLSRFDFDRAELADPGNVGRFSQSGSTLSVRWGDGQVTEAELQPGTGNCFHWNGGLFCPAQPFPSGTRLDGTFSGGASVSGGQLMASTTVSFTADGRYRASNIYSIDTGGFAGAGQGDESGSYTIDGTLLTLRADGREVRRVVAFPYDDGSAGPKPRRIYFNGIMLKR